MTIRTKTLIVFSIALSTLLTIMYVTHLLSLSTNCIILSFLAFGVGFLVILFLILDKLVLSRVNYLTEIVRDVGTSRDMSKRFLVKGKDELSNLGAAINRMLMELQTSENNLRRIEENNRAIMGVMPDTICEFSKDGTLKGWKPAKDGDLPFWSPNP